MIFCSPYHEVSIPDVPLTSFVLHNAEDFGTKPALIDGVTGRAISYIQLTSSIRNMAANLSQRGFRKGDVFAIYSPNIPEYAIAVLAVAMLGGVVTTINPLYTIDELTDQLTDTAATYLLTIAPCLEKACTAAKRSSIKEIFLFDNGANGTPFATLLEGNDNVPHVEIRPSNDNVILPYSSGTTGIPKGVQLTHRNLVANMCQLDGIEDVSSINENDTLLGLLPFFHIYGMTVILNYGLYKHATIITLPRFDLERCLQILQNYKVTIAHLVPPIIRQLAQHPIVEKYNVSTLRRIRSGAAPLDEGTAHAASARLGCPVVQGYGLNETSPVTHVCPDKPDRIKMKSVGPSIPNTEVRIVDPNEGVERQVNQEGEIWIRGPQVMKGYFNQPEATKAILDNEGWLHTGDIGYVDEDGYLVIVDRLKELIKYKGYSIAPAELEGLLVSHPAVRDVAVIPSPDEEAGEVPKAFVVLSEKIPLESLTSFVAEHAAPQKKIKKIEEIDQIPRTASGKILRRVLIERERAHSAIRSS